MVASLPDVIIEPIVRAALAEDLGRAGDVTTMACIPAAGSVGCAIDRARSFAGHLMKVEVEVDSLDQFDEALKHSPDVIMLDNFGLAELAEAVRRAAGRVTLEASGGVNLSTVRDIAATGVDVISVGALTHSAAVLDIGLDAA
jgi:nicotinate-nucleotide pyrophosphorylase (carboxylating)